LEGFSSPAGDGPSAEEPTENAPRGQEHLQNGDTDHNMAGEEGLEDERGEEDELAALLLQHGAVHEGSVNLDAALGYLVSCSADGEDEN